MCNGRSFVTDNVRFAICWGLLYLYGLTLTQYGNGHMISKVWVELIHSKTSTDSPLKFRESDE